MVSGLIGKKVGMTQIFREDGVMVPVTVIQAGPCVVVQKKTKQKDVKKAKAAATSHNRYDKVNEDEFLISSKHSAAVDFGLDTHGTFAGADVASIPKRIHSSKPTTRPSEDHRRTESTSEPPKQPASKSNTPDKPKPRPRPIIVVPGSVNPDALLTLYNVSEFLVQQTYVLPTEVKSDKPIRDSKVEIQHVRKNGQTSKFTVVDSVTKLTRDDWNNVIAVFVQGQEWQFKNWKWSTPAEIFSHVKGFYMYFDDEKIPNCVTSWNVALLPVNKYKRHLDNPAVMKFWNAIEAELMKKKWSA